MFHCFPLNLYYTTSLHLIVCAKFSGTALLTPAQIQWLKTQKDLARTRECEETRSNRWRAVVSHAWYQRLIGISTGCHLLVTGFVEHPIALASFHILFTVLYVCDLALNCFVFGLKKYFTMSHWNVFDTIVVLLFVTLPILTQSFAGTSFLKAMNFTRIAAFSPRLKGTQLIIDVLAECILPVFNVTCVMTTFLYVYVSTIYYVLWPSLLLLASDYLLRQFLVCSCSPELSMGKRLEYLQASILFPRRS